MSEVEGIDVCRGIQSALEKARSYGKEVFIIGGAKIYEQTIDFVDKMYLSYVREEVEGDVFFPRFNQEDWEVEKKESFDKFDLVVLRRKKHEPYRTIRS